MAEIELRLGTGELDFYNPISLRSIPEEDLRAEYRRLRKIAMDRFRRIRKSPDFADSAVLKNNEYLLRTPASKVKESDLRSGLSSLASLTSSHMSTLSGLRRQRDITLENFKEAGYTGITKANWGDFQKFMKATQVFRLAYLPYPKKSASSEAVEAARSVRPELFNLQQSSNISIAAIQKNFEFFKNNLDQIKEAADAGLLKPKSRPYSANDVRRALGMKEEEGYKSVKEAKRAANYIRREARSNAHKRKK